MTSTYAVGSKAVPFSFAEVVLGVFTRYPNPLASHVKTSDVVEPFTIGNDGELTGKSLTLKNNPIPTFMSSWKPSLHYNGAPVVALVEEYGINLAAQRLTHLSRNISSREYLKTHERVAYSTLGSTDPSLGVVIEKEMACSTPLRFSYPIRKYVGSRWKKNSYKQTHGLCYTISNNAYCPTLANQFLTAGQNLEKWNRAVERLQYLRQLAQNKRAQINQTVKYAIDETVKQAKSPQNIQRLHDVVKKVPKP